MKRDAAPIDPGDSQAQRLAAHQIGELRLTRMENVLLRHAGIVDEVAKERAVRLVALGALSRADDIEGSPERRPGEQVVVDIGDDGLLVTSGEPIQCRRHILVE